MGNNEFFVKIDFRPIGAAGSLEDAHYLVLGPPVEPAINFTRDGHISAWLKFEGRSPDDATLVAQQRMCSIFTPSRYRFVACTATPAINNPTGGVFSKATFRLAAHRLVETREGGSLVGTIAIIDIVGSTRLAVELGDKPWSQLLSKFKATTRAAVAAAGGLELKDTGDGFLLFWPGIGVDTALRCLQEVRQRVETLNITIRGGLHWGEFRRIGGDVGGLEIHIAARVIEHAGQSGRFLMTGSVRDLLTEDCFGQPLRYALRDIEPHDWYLYEA